MTTYACVVNLTAFTNSFGNVTLAWSTSQTITTTYTSNFSFADPGFGVTEIEVQTIGGGAGGGGTLNGFGAGYNGYGGNYVDAFFNPTALTYPIACTIGAGGTGGASQVNHGSNGGTTTFGSYITCPGGVYYPTAQGIPVVTGDLSHTIEAGGSEASDIAGSWNTVHAGAAGASSQGTGLPSQAVTGGICSSGPGGNGGSVAAGPSSGGAGSNYGGGGAGAGCDASGNGTGVGGNGAPGVIIITLTFTTAQSFDIYRDGVLIGSTTDLYWTDPSPSVGAHSYKIIPVSSSQEVLSGQQSVSAQVSATVAYVYGKFVSSEVFAAVQVSQVGNIKPRIWSPKNNNTVQA